MTPQTVKRPWMKLFSKSSKTWIVASINGISLNQPRRDGASTASWFMETNILSITHQSNLNLSLPYNRNQSLNQCLNRKKIKISRQSSNQYKRIWMKRLKLMILWRKYRNKCQSLILKKRKIIILLQKMPKKRRCSKIQSKILKKSLEKMIKVLFKAKNRLHQRLTKANKTIRLTEEGINIVLYFELFSLPYKKRWTNLD